jgi:hypothetical protein
MPAEPFTLSALAVLLFINGIKAIMSIAKRFRRSSCTGSNGERIEIDLTKQPSRPASEREQTPPSSPRPQRAERSRSHSRGRRRSRDSTDDSPRHSRSNSK